jgi:hypothetical protein
MHLIYLISELKQVTFLEHGRQIAEGPVPLRGANPMIVATRAAQQPGLLVRKHYARGEDLHWNEGL